MSLSAVLRRDQFELGLTTIILSHVTFSMSYVTMTYIGRLQDFDWSADRGRPGPGATVDDGAARLRPLLAPDRGRGPARLHALDRRLRDHSSSSPGRIDHLAGPDLQHDQARPAALINALSTLLLVVTFVTVWLSQRLMGDTR